MREAHGSEEMPVVSFRVPAALKEAFEQMAERMDCTPSPIWVMAGWNAVETNMETLALSAEIDNLREQIKEYYRPIDQAGGFPGRCARDFEKRFQNGYSPKWLSSIAESYRDEAEMLERKVAAHPDAPDIEDGELVDAVEEELAQTLEATDLSNWFDRRDNRYEKFGGVQDAQERREFYVAAVQGAMRTRQDIGEAFNSVSVHVAADDLPEKMEDPLPLGVDRQDVAKAANELAEMGVEQDDVPEALERFDPRAWADEPADDEPDAPADDEPDEPAEAPDAPADDEPEPAPQAALPDGGAEPEGPVAVAGDETEYRAEITTPNPNRTMPKTTPETPERTEIVDHLAEKARSLLGSGPDSKVKQMLPTMLKASHEKAVENADMDIPALVDDAVRRARDEDPEAAGTEGSA